MKKYLKDYISLIDDKIKNKKVNKNIIEEHLIKIRFFQHERLIHLLVTLFYFIFMVIFFIISWFYNPCVIIGIILFIFNIFYVIHYFRLENGVQYLYKQYDKMINLI